MEPKCRECGGMIIVNDWGEQVCIKCGLVNEEPVNPIYLIRDYHDGYVFLEEKAGSIIISQKMRKLSKYNDNFRFKTGSEIKIRQTTIRIARKMYLLDVDIENIFNLYKRIKKELNKNKMTKGVTNYTILAASFYIYLRKNGKNITSKEVIKIFNSIGHKIGKKTLNKLIFQLKFLQIYKESFNWENQINNYILLLIKKLGYNYKITKILNDIKKEILNYINLLPPQVKQRKIPSTIILAALYLVLQNKNIKIEITSLGRMFGKSPHTLEEMVKIYETHIKRVQAIG